MFCIHPRSRQLPILFNLSRLIRLSLKPVARFEPQDDDHNSGGKQRYYEKDQEAADEGSPFFLTLALDPGVSASPNPNNQPDGHNDAAEITSREFTYDQMEGFL